jgi:predicted RNA-binding Zn-ribbon protein involved in translation (DUF1610 family)
MDRYEKKQTSTRQSGRRAIFKYSGTGCATGGRFRRSHKNSDETSRRYDAPSPSSRSSTSTFERQWFLASPRTFRTTSGVTWGEGSVNGRHMTRATKMQHSCPHCGAVYSVHDREGSSSTYYTAVCSACGDVMAEWEGQGRRYRRERTRLDPVHRTAAIVAAVRQAAASVPHVKKKRKLSTERNSGNRKTRGSAGRK